MDARVIRTLRSLTLATLVLSLTAQPAYAFTKQGSTSCSVYKRVHVYSTAEREVYHWYRGYYVHWHNLGLIYRENSTGLSQTWWTIEYDAAIVQPWGAICESI